MSEPMVARAPRALMSEVRRRSVRAAMLSAVGFVIFSASILYSAFRLQGAQQMEADLRTSVEQKRAELALLQRENARQLEIKAAVERELAKTKQDVRVLSLAKESALEEIDSAEDSGAINPQTAIDIKVSLQSDPKQLARHEWNRGQKNLEKHLDAHARARFERALELDPNYDPAYASLGLLALDSGKLDEAARYFTDAVRVNGTNDTALKGLAQLYLSQGNPQKAMQYATRAVAVSPQSQKAKQILRNAELMLRAAPVGTSP